MRRLSLLASLALLLPALPSRAQVVSIYGTFSPSHISNIPNGNSTASPGYVTADYWAPGVGAGLTLNFIPVGPVKLGVDFRGSTKPGTSGDDLILVGPRLAVNLPLVRLKPYIQASGGYLRTRTALATSTIAGSTFTHTYGAWEVAGGIDNPITPFFDLRLIEVGSGKGYLVNSSGFSPDANATIFTLSTGLVFHF